MFRPHWLEEYDAAGAQSNTRGFIAAVVEKCGRSVIREVRARVGVRGRGSVLGLGFRIGSKTAVSSEKWVLGLGLGLSSPLIVCSVQGSRSHPPLSRSSNSPTYRWSVSMPTSAVVEISLYRGVKNLLDVHSFCRIFCVCVYLCVSVCMCFRLLFMYQTAVAAVPEALHGLLPQDPSPSCRWVGIEL